MLNALTIDLEDYFQVHAFSKVIRHQDWEKYESRVERNAHRLLEILSGSILNPQSEIRNRCSATFFVLGWIAERYSGLVREIRRQGHEIASHGCHHRVISSMSPKEFREDVRRSKAVLEDITGEVVIGYRAPTFSINVERLWALEILAEEGYRYDSSIFPIRHDNYGIPDAPRFPFTVLFSGNGKVEFVPEPPINGGPRPGLSGRASTGSDSPAFWAIPQSAFRNPKSEIRTPQSIVEFPLSTIRLFRRNFPISGGGYFRLLPYGIIRNALRRINREEKQPFIFYLHPWEIDAEQPRIAGAGMRSEFRHYLNLNKTENKLKRLLAQFQFSSVGEIIRRSPIGQGNFRTA